MIALINYEFKKLLNWKFLIVIISFALLLNIIILSNKIDIDSECNEFKMLNHIDTQTKKEMSYDEFLRGVEEQAENMKESQLFQNNKFNRENVEKTEKAYRKLYGLKIEGKYKTGLLYVTDYRITDILLLLTIIGILLHMLLYERTEGLFLLIKPSKNGRSNIIISKYIVMVISAVILTALFFATNYMIVLESGLTGSGLSPIQSLKGYIASPYRININEYIVLFFIFKSLAMVSAGSIIFLICICCRNQVYSVLLLTAIAISEIFLCYNIENYSWLSPLKQFNFASVMDTSAYFNDYINFNMFGISVSSMVAGVIFMITTSIISLLCSIIVFSKEADTQARITKILKTHSKSNSDIRIYESLFMAETKKILIVHKGLLLLVVLMLVQVASYYDVHFSIDETEAYYLKYSTILAGEISEEKDVFIEQENKRFKENVHKLTEQYRRYEKGEITLSVLNYYEDELTTSKAEIDGFEKAKEQYESIRKKADEYSNIAYVYETGWEKLIGTENLKEEAYDFFKLIIILLLSFAGVGTYEKETGVEYLIKTSQEGLKGVYRMKRRACILYTLLAATMTFAFRLYMVYNYYTLPAFGNGMQSLCMFDGININLPMGILLVMIYAVKLMLAEITGVTILYISSKVSHEYAALILGGMIFLIPIILIIYFL